MTLLTSKNQSSRNEMNHLLGICIPTFNRGRTLGEGINKLIELVAPYSIPIYISDNASVDDTQIVLNQAAIKYPYIFYQHNSTNIGMDRNFEAALKMAATRYAWLLGDDDLIRPGAIEQILLILKEQDFDLLVLNGGHIDPRRSRVNDIQTKTYTSPQQLFVELGWHMTWMSSLVFNQKILAEMNFKKYYDTYFVHIGAIFDHLVSKPNTCVKWVDGSFFYPSSNAVFSWSSSVLNIFSDHWMRVVDSLNDAYSQDEKRQCIKNHSKHTGLFSFSGILNLRAKGSINLSNVRKSRGSLKMTSDVPLVIIILIALIPVWPLERLRWLCLKLH